MGAAVARRCRRLVPDPAELHAFAVDVRGPLAARTPETRDLRETLQVLLDTNFNVAEAARAQFFHYNTMRYRVAKLERLIGARSPPTRTCGWTWRSRCGAGDRRLRLLPAAASAESAHRDLIWHSRER